MDKGAGTEKPRGFFAPSLWTDSSVDQGESTWLENFGYARDGCRRKRAEVSDTLSGVQPKYRIPRVIEAEAEPGFAFYERLKRAVSCPDSDRRHPTSMVVGPQNDVILILRSMARMLRTGCGGQGLKLPFRKPRLKLLHGVSALVQWLLLCLVYWLT